MSDVNSPLKLNLNFLLSTCVTSYLTQGLIKVTCEVHRVTLLVQYP